MVDYLLTPAAKSDLKDIWNYTVQSFGLNQAERYMLKIENKLYLLASNPQIGIKRPEIKDGYYSFPVEKHIVFYLIKDDSIIIIGILHCKMDIKKQLT